jgi:protein TonB
LIFDAKCGVTQPAPIENVSVEDQKFVTPPKINPRRPLPFPAYPPSALRAGQAGTAYVSALITETGAVAETRLKRSSGFVELDNAAMENTRSWQLLPARFRENPVCMWATFPIIFSVHDKNAVDSKDK